MLGWRRRARISASYRNRRTLSRVAPPKRSVFNATPPAEILATDADPLEALDLMRNLSPTRRNGLAAVRATILDFARRCG